DNGKVTFSVVGLGGRASAYLNALQECFPEDYQVVAVAEPDEAKRATAKKQYGLSDAQLFLDDLSFMQQPRLSDVVIIGTQDALHYRETMAFLEKGYDIILEKPISVNPKELMEIYSCAKKRPNQLVAVCHVLRHTALFNRVREVIASGEFGRVVSVQHNENVGYYHFAHSYVRGQWNNDATSGPIIMTKSCHDMDILLFLLGDKRAERVASFGELSIFNPQNFDPKRMTEFCVDCSLQQTCPYSAVRLYNSNKIKSVMFDMTSSERIRESLSDTPYGRCVYASKNNVADHQSTILQFQDGITATFNLSAFTGKVNRTLKVMCEFGEIRASEKPYIVETTSFFTDKVTEYPLDIRERG
ncbi:MAG: Gfo/Idh/MocA family oxidoreductase, partial [Oscillospiraceae bacterium]